MISVHRKHLESTSLGIAIIDPTGKILFVNKTLRRFIPGKLIGSQCWSVFWNQEMPCQDCLLGKSMALKSSGRINATDFPEKRSVQVDQLSIFYRGIPAVMEIFRDITPGREEVVQEKIEEEKLNAIRTLSATYSHHIFNAIAPVSGYAELLLKNENLTDEQRKRLEIIIKNVTRVVDLVHKMEKTNSCRLTHFGGFDILDISDISSRTE